MGQVSSTKSRVARKRGGGYGDGNGDGNGDASISVTTTSVVSKPRSPVKSKQQFRRASKQLPPLTEGAPVVFIPFPYERPDSKPLDHKNAREKTIIELLHKYACQDTSLVVENFTLGAKVVVPGVNFAVTGFIDHVVELVTVFPDFHFEYKLIGETSPGVVVAIVQACGTHSGAPYTTPGNPKPMPPRNALCKNDPEILTCIFQGNKIKECSFLPASTDTRYHGPDGFYRRIVEHDLKRRWARQQLKDQKKTSLH
jgi:hypothetical protein